MTPSVKLVAVRGSEEFEKRTGEQLRGVPPDDWDERVCAFAATCWAAVSVVFGNEGAGRYAVGGQWLDKVDTLCPGEQAESEGQIDEGPRI